MPETLFPLPEPKLPTAAPARGKPRLLRANRQQVEMHLASLDELLPDDHRARLVWAAVEQLDLSAFYAPIQAVVGEAGHPAIDPALLLAVWLYATLDGVGSARAVDRLCREHLAYRWLLGGVSVNYHTLADFRVSREAELDDLLTRSVAALMAEGLVDLARTAQDGVRLRASAGASSFRREATLQACLQQAEAHVQALKAEAEADPTDPPSSAPATPRGLAARQRAARERVARVQQALQAVAQVAGAKARQRERKRQARPARASTTDPAARVMKLPDGGFRPAYNGQLSVDMDSRIIVGVEVSNQADSRQLMPMLAQTQARYGRWPAEHYVDGGFRTQAGITAVAAQGVTLYTPLARRYSRPNARRPEAVQPSDPPALAEWKQRMQTEAAQAAYRDRAATVEWANALLRLRGLQRLLVRGLQKARAVLLWFVLAHNLLQAAARRQARQALPA